MFLLNFLSILPSYLFSSVFAGDISINYLDSGNTDLFATYHRKIDSPSSKHGFGYSVASCNIGSNGKAPRWVISAPFDEGQGSQRGAFYLEGGPDNEMIKFDDSILDIPNREMLGVSAVICYDFNKDGVEDIALGAPESRRGGTQFGAVHIVYLNSDQTVLKHAVIDSSLLNQPDIQENQMLGESITAFETQEGIFLAASVDHDNDKLGLKQSGAVYIFPIRPNGDVLPPVFKIDGSNPNGPQLTHRASFGSSMDVLKTNEGVLLIVGASGIDNSSDKSGVTIVNLKSNSTYQEGDNRGAVFLLPISADGRSLRGPAKRIDSPLPEDVEGFGGKFTIFEFKNRHFMISGTNWIFDQRVFILPMEMTENELQIGTAKIQFTHSDENSGFGKVGVYHQEGQNVILAIGAPFSNDKNGEVNLFNLELR